MSENEVDLDHRLIVPPADDGFFVDEPQIFWLERCEERTYVASMSPSGVRGHHSFDPARPGVEGWLRRSVTYRNWEVHEAPHKAGEYHPRIHRGGWPGPVESLPYRNSWRAAGVALRKILEQLASMFGAVEPARANAGTYSHELRQLLILACMEVEAAWRGVLKENDARVRDRTTTVDYVRLKQPMRLDEWRLCLALYDDWDEIAPFEAWDPQDTTRSLGWYDAYNHTKHDREGHLDQASLNNVIDAVAALHVMMWAQFGEDSMEAFGLPALVGFKVVQRPKWQPEELYFGGKDTTTPRPRPLW